MSHWREDMQHSYNGLVNWKMRENANIQRGAADARSHEAVVLALRHGLQLAKDKGPDGLQALDVDAWAERIATELGL